MVSPTIIPHTSDYIPPLITVAAAGVTPDVNPANLGVLGVFCLLMLAAFRLIEELVRRVTKTKEKPATGELAPEFWQLELSSIRNPVNHLVARADKQDDALARIINILERQSDADARIARSLEMLTSIERQHRNP